MSGDDIIETIMATCIGFPLVVFLLSLVYRGVEWLIGVVQ